MATEGKSESGVQALIDRLKAEGVEEGRREAARIVDEARREAEGIVGAARAEAQRIVGEGTARAAAIDEATREGLRLAVRDALLDLKAQLTAQFRDRLQRLVALKMADGPFVERLILEIAGRIRDEHLGDRPVEILLPREVVNLDDLHRHPEAIERGTLAHFALNLTTDMLREGVSLAEGPEAGGLRLRLEGEEVDIELTDRSVEEILLAHLLPRFRALLEGIIH